tara:strand:+ start:15631 stop:16620 length:990 start_codon:yes stop_codon:yes gene_type:complete
LINNLGIIGLGSIGRRHLRLVKELHPEINIIAVRSGKGNKVEEEKLLNAVFYSLDEAIDHGIEAAIIATPSIYHTQQAINLMEGGVHVLIEKPLSNSLNNIARLIKVNKKTKKVALLGYCLRYSSCAIQFKKLLQDEYIGRILHVQVDCSSYLPNWREDQDYRMSVSAKADLGGGVLTELSHEFHYIRWFFGNMKHVSANIQNSGVLDIDVEDSADMNFESEKGIKISVHLDFNCQKITRRCFVRCSNGDLIWDILNNQIIWSPINGDKELETYQNDLNYIYRKQLEHFFDCIENNKKPSVSINDGIAIIHIIDAIKKSSNIGEKVAFK